MARKAERKLAEGELAEGELAEGRDAGGVGGMRWGLGRQSLYLFYLLSLHFLFASSSTREPVHMLMLKVRHIWIYDKSSRGVC